MNSPSSSNVQTIQKAYDVFISYARHDKAFAIRLQTALERYRPALFSGIRPRRLRVFRDESEAADSRLDEALKSALGRSRYLVVLCSPSSRDSPWVNDEIRLFGEQNSADQIVPILIAGRPNSEAVRKDVPHESAFPVALMSALGSEPWAPDFRTAYSKGRSPKSDRVAWFHLIAKLYGTSRENIEKRERKRRTVRAAIASAAGLVVAFNVYYFWGMWKEGQSRALAEQVGKLQDPDQAIRIAALAVDEAPTDQALAAFRNALSRRFSAVWDFHVDNNDSAIRVDSSGQTVAIASPYGGLRVWRAFGSEAPSVCTFVGPVREISVSPDGKYAFWANELKKVVGFWNIQSRTLKEVPVPTLKYRYGYPKLLIDSRSKVVALAHMRNDGRLWRIADGAIIGDLPSKFGDIVTFSPSGAFLSQYGRDGQAVAVWRTEDGSMLRTYNDDGRVHFAGFSGDERKALFLSDPPDDRKSVLVTRQSLLQLEILGDGSKVESESIDPKTLLSASPSARQELNDLYRIVLRKEHPDWLNTQYPVSIIVADQATIALASGRDAAEFLFDAATLQKGPPLAPTSRNLYHYKFSSNGELLAAARGPIWDTKTGRQLWELSDDLMEIEFSPDGTRLYALADDVATVYSARTGNRLARFEPASEWRQKPRSDRLYLKFLFLSRDNKRALFRSNHDVFIWDIEHQTQKRLEGSYWEDSDQFETDRATLEQSFSAAKAHAMARRWSEDCPSTSSPRKASEKGRPL
jgi:WD40 repeat protein